MQKELTVFIGRFSIFHLGHAEVLERALQTSKVVLVLVGSSFAARSIKNPFTFEERRDVITSWYISNRKIGLGKLHILPIQDNPYNDPKWIQSVQQAVIETKAFYNIHEDEPVHLTGAKRDESSWYLDAFGGFFTHDLVKETRTGFGLNATLLRTKYFTGDTFITSNLPEDTFEFLVQFKETPEYLELCKEQQYITAYKKSWELAPFKPTFHTTDCVVIQSGHVLVITRGNFPGRGLWALPGGFLEEGETLQTGALRELVEETNIELAPAQLIGSVKASSTFDHPDRSLRGRTITTAFLLKLQDNKPLPKIKPQTSELLGCKWIPIFEALNHPELWFEDHYFILQSMLDQIHT